MARIKGGLKKIGGVDRNAAKIIRSVVVVVVTHECSAMKSCRVCPVGGVGPLQ